MEAKKWSFAVTLIFVFAALPLTCLILQDPNKCWEFMDTILGILEGTKPSTNYKVDGDNNYDQSVSPNLTSCHSSYGRPDLLVYCCPPTSEGEEAIIDFEFPNPSSPLRIRRQAHHVDEEYIGKYEKALSLMKSLPHSDPRSFSRQADMHCIFCTGAYDQPNSHLPLDIHRKWFFFPWHRMMLHFHERILGSLIGDDTFALPFWNWDSPDGMTSPEWYLMNAPFFDTQRDVSHFPPRIGDLNFRKQNGYVEPEDQIKLNLAFMYTQMVSGAKKPELFMGCPDKAWEGGVCDGPGTVESAPHNTMHTWVGSSFNPQRENMGAFYSAARDPMFHAHHSNLDRLWEVWTRVHKIELHNFDPAWLNSFFYFHDENSRLVRIKILDVLDTRKLRYVYQEVDLPWLNMRPKPSVPSKIANHALKVRENRTNILSADQFGPSGRNLESSITVKVNRSKYNRRKQEKEEEEEVLVVHGIEAKSDEYVKFDVYINVVDESIVSPGFREFAGTFVHIPNGKRGGNGKSNIKLGISELLEDLEADRDESIWVTLLPRTTSCTYTKIDGIRIEYMR